jgi:hypothetical protein
MVIVMGTDMPAKNTIFLLYFWNQTKYYTDCLTFHDIVLFGTLLIVYECETSVSAWFLDTESKRKMEQSAN